MISVIRSVEVKSSQIKIVLAILVAVITRSAWAGDPELVSRIKQLEETLKAMQQQRAEQDKQLEVLTKELAGVENQLTQSKNTKAEERGKSKGNAVFASTKDGLVFEDGTGDWSMQFNGRIQADYRSIDPHQWKNDTWDIRRARLGGTFNFLKDFSVRVEGEYSNTNDGSKSTTALTYGYLDWKHFPGAKVRIGQFKPIFGLERGESTNFTDFQELSLATATGAVFNSTYDRGIMLFGSPLKGVNYNAYWVNGSGQNNDAMQNGKDVGGRVAINLADYMSFNNSIVHVGVSASKNTVQKSSASVSGNSTALSAYSESNGVTSNTIKYPNSTATQFFSTLDFSDGNVEKTRLGLETALAYGPVKFQSEYIRANFDGNNIDKDIDAWYASLTWLLTGESYANSYKDGMFGRITPNRNLTFGQDGWGAFELGLRYSNFDASDFKLAANGCAAGTGCLTSSSYTNKADAWTGGAKWMVNPNARILFNYVHTNFDTPIIINSKSSGHEDAVTMRAQYDF
jgi:phosphate-selective porin OprO/OprP